MNLTTAQRLEDTALLEHWQTVYNMSQSQIPNMQIAYDTMADAVLDTRIRKSELPFYQMIDHKNLYSLLDINIAQLITEYDMDFGLDPDEDWWAYMDFMEEVARLIPIYKGEKI